MSLLKCNILDEGKVSFFPYIPSVLKFLQAHVFLGLVVQSGPGVGVVNDSGSFAGVGLSFQFTLVLDGFDGTAENDELGPPLRIGIQDGLDGIRGGDIVAVEHVELGEDPSNSGEHGRSAVAEFGLAKVFGRSPLGKSSRVELHTTKEKKNEMTMSENK